MPEIKTLDELIDSMVYISQNHKSGAPRDVIVADLDEFAEELSAFLESTEAGG